MDDGMIVFLDMDGVCCDFISSALQIHGTISDNPGGIWSNWPRGVWEVEKVLGISTEQFWRPIEWAGSQFWENLDPYPWFEDLIEVVEPFSPIICTAPSKDPECLVGKARWLQKHGIHGFRSVFTHQKHLLGKPDRVLIDDSKSNCHQFEQEGGHAIRIPQPWNDFLADGSPFEIDVPSIVGKRLDEIQRGLS